MKNLKLIYILFFLTTAPMLGYAQQIANVSDINNPLKESSGLIYLNHKLITHNDSNGEAVLYELDSVSGNVTRTVAIDNATNIDWEDLSYDDNYIYIGDFGNNLGSRIDLKVYRISILDYFTTTTDRVIAEIINFSYSDQTDFQESEFTNFDAEALISYKDNLYIFSKNKTISSSGTSNIYRLSKTPGTYQIDKIDSINFKESLFELEVITGSTYDNKTNKILLTGYNVNSSRVITSSFIVEISNITSDLFSNGTIQKTLIEPLSGYSKQIESITRSNRNQYFLTAEQNDSGSAVLYWLNTATTDKYRLMYNNNPSTEITIAWNQITGIDQTVYYGTSDHGTNWSSYPNSKIPDHSVNYLNMSNQFVKLTDLTPETKYYFVIKDSEGTSERFWFRTISDNNNKRLSIISGGDSRYSESIDRVYRQNSNKMVAKLRPHAVLFGGDLIASPGREPDTMSKWLDDWQLSITSDNQIIPVVHSYGNHESDNPEGDLNTLKRLFDTPEDNYYNVKFGKDLFSFYVLNGELLPNTNEDDNTKRIAQRNWLENELATDNSIWKSAGYHRPISPHNSGKIPSKASFDDWVNYFYNHGVRLIAESDAHLVKLTQELKPTSSTAIGDDPENWFETKGIDQDKGITFIGGGSWGIIREADESYSYTLGKDSFHAFNFLFIDRCSIEIRTLNTQTPGIITERTEETRFNLGDDIDAVLWKPEGLPSGVKTIYKSSIWNGNSWACGEPNSVKSAIINANYNHSDGNIETNHLTIKQEVALNFDNATTNSIIVHGNLTVDGTFIIGDTESLVIFDNQTNIEGNIIKYENSTSRSNTHDFTYWSSPVSNETIESVFTGVAPTRIFHYDQSRTTTSDSNNDPDGTYWDVWVLANQSDLMQPGKGYAAEGIVGTTGIHELTFNGIPNNGIIEIDVFYNNDVIEDRDNDFNLIGNPYPSAINIDSFFVANVSFIEPTAYLWTHNTEISNVTSGDYVSSDYATYNLSGGVGVGEGQDPESNFGSAQGFFVRALNSGKIRFTNDMRIADNNDQFYKNSNEKDKEEKDRIWLNLTTNQYLL